MDMKEVMEVNKEVNMKATALLQALKEVGKFNAGNIIEILEKEFTHKELILMATNDILRAIDTINKKNLQKRNDMAFQ